MAVITSPLGDAERKLTGDALQGALVDLINISLTAKQYHWNLVGARFRSIHLQLDEVVGVARTHADTVAERAAAIGVNPDGRAKTVAVSEVTDADEAGWLSDDTVVSRTVAMLRRVGELMRARIDAVAEADPVTQDILIDVSADLEKQAWMFEAQLSRTG
ncbi:MULTISPECIES: Dps family protein [unclassified Nonomuraea]|uniref:Dps family protein n=1 Tax=Nonomuraea sp. NPDC003804 TaxID=3154547 RepID=UPI0033B0B897